MKRTFCILLAFMLTLSCTGCQREDRIPDTTASHTETVSTTLPQDTSAPSTAQTETEAYFYNETSYPLFSPEATAIQPATITQEEMDSIDQELEVILASKTYPDTANELIRDTVAYLYQCYPNYESLFAFLNPPDTATYIRNYILQPLDRMVDTIECNISEGAGSGYAADYDRKISLNLTYEPDINAVILVHELHHMTVCIEHNIYSSSIYNPLTEGSATLQEMTLIGTPYFQSLSASIGSSQRYPDPDHENCYLVTRGHGSFSYALYSSIYFKLYALTDFAAMEYFLEPKGEQKIRQELIARYGQDGADLYDTLENIMAESTFENAMKSESLFLKLFTSRLSEVKTIEDMYHYMQLYRIYRLVFSPEYVQEILEGDEINGYASYTSEISHPSLDFDAADSAVAEAVLNWNILNTEDLTESELLMIVNSLVSRQEAPYNSAYCDRYFYEGYQSFTVTGATRTHVNRTNDDYIQVLLGNGSELVCIKE